MSDVAYVRLADLSTRFSIHVEAVESYRALYGSTARIISTCENVIPCKRKSRIVNKDVQKSQPGR